MLQRPYVVLDFETTGLGAADRVIEIAAIRVERSRRIEFHSLCDPGQPLPPFIQGLTGLTDEDLAGAPPTTLAIKRLVAEVLYDSPLFIAHNASFDRRFLDQELVRAKMAPFAGPVSSDGQLVESPCGTGTGSKCVAGRRGRSPPADPYECAPGSPGSGC